MRASPSVLSALAILPALLASLPAQRPDRPRREPPPPVELKNFTFATKSFRSEAIGEDAPYGIYLPAGYDDEKNKQTVYPLAIWLHGMFENHTRFHERGGAPVLDQAVTDGKLPPCVFVLANGGRTSLYVNRKDEKWEDLITKDLLEHLASTYRVSKQREQRAILGVSMGGMAALRIALTRPELFGTVAVHSAAVFPEDPEKLSDRIKGNVQRMGLTEVLGDPIQQEPWRKTNPLCLAVDADKKALAGLQVYFDAGTEDRYGFDAGNQLLHDALDKKGLPHTFRLIEGGGHSWGARFQDETLPHSFALVGRMFQTAAAKAKGLEGLKGQAGGDSRDGKEPPAEPGKGGR